MYRHPGFGISFAADVIKRYRQLVLVVRETSTSFTASCLLNDERRESIRSGLLRLCLELSPLSGPLSVISVDPAPGFASLCSDEILRKYGVAVEVGRVKNSNKNPVAEKCVAELGDELLRICPNGGTITPLSLAVATDNLNTRIRNARCGFNATNSPTHRYPFLTSKLFDNSTPCGSVTIPLDERSKTPGRLIIRLLLLDLNFQESFPQLHGSVSKLDPFIYKDGVLRVGCCTL